MRPPCNLEQAASVVGKSPSALRKQLERLRRAMGGGVVRFADFEAVFNSGSGWQVTFGESWYVDDKLGRWLPTNGAAPRTRTKADSLRCAARRNRPENSEESACADVKAKHLGTRWLYFVGDYVETGASGEAGP